jgi:hypothetical protein
MREGNKMKKYYIIDGATGNILRSTNDNSGYLSVWQTISGWTQDYWTYVKLPEEREMRIRI